MEVYVLVRRDACIVCIGLIKYSRPNLGQARHIPAHPPPNIHHTVLLRSARTGYRPKAKLPAVYNVVE